MSEVKFLKIVNGLPKEMDSSVDQVTLNSFSIQDSGPILSGSGLDLKNLTLSNLADGVEIGDAINKGQLDAAIAGVTVDLEFEQEVYVAKNGDDLIADGSLTKPYATIKAALESITDASPSKRYAIRVQAGNYVETGDFELKANVFVLGADRNSTRITATSFKMAADFTGSADNRSGFSNLTVLSPCVFDWAAVTSSAGKLYFQNVQFNTTLSLNGHNNATAQVQMWGTSHFGNFTVSGMNLLTVGIRIYSSSFMNQHPSLPTVWDANGGSCGALTITTTVNNFNRRCSMFAKNFFMDNPLVVDGPVSYCDYTAGSIPNNNSAVNGGQLIPLNPSGANTALSNLAFPTAVNQPIMPANTNTTNFGDWGKQWFWNFGYVHASTGTDLFVASYPSAFGADAGPNGKSIALVADAAGLQTNVNGGNISLSTANVSGTGVRGRVIVDARELSMGSSKIVLLADGTDANDAVNKSQLDSAVASVSAVQNLQRSFTAEVAIAQRDVVIVSSADSVSPAQADDVNSSICIGFAVEAADAAAPVVIRNEGVVPGFSGLTPGARYYLSAASAGAITDVAPSGSGEVVFQVGIAKSATELLIQKQFMYIVT
jgi:hypothetical protein